jgi:S-adenosylmethionine-diacylgycerolhomoserine-N-methlytransferase
MQQFQSEHASAEVRGELAGPDHHALMDRIYQHQRHIYDLTRRFFLLGRDALIERMHVEPGHRILEVGCGTARNLVELAGRYPEARFFGIDASGEMLKSARTNMARAGVEHQISLACCLAEDVCPETLFGLAEPFDGLFFSYSLSMMPEWQAALNQGLVNLRTGGSLWVVDFWDQGDLPNWFAVTLQAWLSLFHVRHRPELLEYFGALERYGQVSLSVEPLYRRYAYLARLTKVV